MYYLIFLSRFIEQNRTTPPPAVSFKFDNALVDNSLKLNPNGVILNDLTEKTLKQRLAENETKLAECRNLIQDKQTLIIQLETEMGTVRFRSDAASVSKTFTLKKRTDLYKKEVNELRCQEQKLTRQNEMIQIPLNELGCQEAPLGVDWTNEGGGSNVTTARYVNICLYESF